MKTLVCLVAFLKAITLPIVKIVGEKRECIIGAYCVDVERLRDRDTQNQLWDLNWRKWNELYETVRDAMHLDGFSRRRMGCHRSTVSVGEYDTDDYTILQAKHWVPPMGELYRVESGLYQWVIDDVVITIQDNPKHAGQYNCIGWGRLAS